LAVTIPALDSVGDHPKAGVLLLGHDASERPRQDFLDTIGLGEKRLYQMLSRQDM